METLEAIARRKSTRSYTDEIISEEILQKILKAGMSAPIGLAKYETLHITVVQSKELITRIFDESEAMISATLGFRKSFNYGAGTMIIVSSQPAYREGMEYGHGGIIIENMVIAATALGVDSCIMGAPIAALAENKELANAVGIPEGLKPVLGVVFGYGTADEPAKEHTITVNRV